MKYRVINVYGIMGDESSTSIRRALNMAQSREGEGWVVVDADGDQWTEDWSGVPTKITGKNVSG